MDIGYENDPSFYRCMEDKHYNEICKPMKYNSIHIVPDFAGAAESEVELAFALGVGRRRPNVPFVGEPAGVERREAD
jgi:hypothetical protein